MPSNPSPASASDPAPPADSPDTPVPIAQPLCQGLSGDAQPCRHFAGGGCLILQRTLQLYGSDSDAAAAVITFCPTYEPAAAQEPAGSLTPESTTPDEAKE